MNVEEAIRQRRSIRHFLPDPIPATELREMLALASRAPSIGNRQMWRFIVVTDGNLRHMLARLVERKIDEIAAWQEFITQPLRMEAWKRRALPFADAPAAIFIVNTGYHSVVAEAVIERGAKSWEVERQFGHPDVQSVSAMIAYLALVAHERGYGACWLTDPLVAKRDLETALELRANEELLAVVALGLPAETPPSKSRKAIDAIIEWR